MISTTTTGLHASATASVMSVPNCKMEQHGFGLDMELMGTSPTPHIDLFGDIFADLQSQAPAQTPSPSGSGSGSQDSFDLDTLQPTDLNLDLDIEDLSQCLKVEPEQDFATNIFNNVKTETEEGDGALVQSDCMWSSSLSNFLERTNR